MSNHRNRIVDVKSHRLSCCKFSEPSICDEISAVPAWISLCHSSYTSQKMPFSALLKPPTFLFLFCFFISAAMTKAPETSRWQLPAQGEEQRPNRRGFRGNGRGGRCYRCDPDIETSSPDLKGWWWWWVEWVGGGGARATVHQAAWQFWDELVNSCWRRLSYSGSSPFRRLLMFFSDQSSLRGGKWSE